MKDVLVVNSDQPFPHSVAGLLKHQSAFFRVHTARNSHQAIQVLKTTPVDLVITSIRFPKFSSLRFVTTLAEEYPSTKVMVITKGHNKFKQGSNKTLPEAIYLDNSTDQDQIIKRVFTELQIDYGGYIRGVALPSFLQMMELENCTCTLSIISKNLEGLLWLQDGELIAARSPTKEGKEAALEIIAWQNVLINIDYAPFDIARQFSISFMMLILESGQQYDEIIGNGKDRRKHSRYELQVATDYVYENQTRQCTLHEISLEGAYIEEIDQAIGLGKTITLELTSPKLRSKCSISTSIVRKDGKGAGVRFNIETPEQEAIILTMIENNRKTNRNQQKEDSLPPA